MTDLAEICRKISACLRRELAKEWRMDVNERLQLVQIRKKTSDEVVREGVNGFRDRVFQDLVKIELENYADVAEEPGEALEMWKTPPPQTSSRKRANAAVVEDATDDAILWESQSPVKASRKQSNKIGLKTSARKLGIGSSVTATTTKHLRAASTASSSTASSSLPLNPPKSNLDSSFDISTIKVEDDSLWNDVKLGASRAVVSLNLLENGELKASAAAEDFIENDHRETFDGQEDVHFLDDAEDISFPDDTEDVSENKSKSSGADADDLSLNLAVEEGVVGNPEDDAASTNASQKKTAKKKKKPKSRKTKPYSSQISRMRKKWRSAIDRKMSAQATEEVDEEGNIVEKKTKTKSRKKGYYELVPVEEEEGDVKPGVEEDGGDRRRRSRKSRVSYNVDELFGEDEDSDVRLDDGQKDEDRGEGGQKKKKTGRPRGKRKTDEDCDDNFSFETVKDTLGLEDSAEESEKENEDEKLQAKAKRQLYKKKIEQMAKINPRVKPPPRAKPPSKILTTAQKEDIKNIKLDEVSAKWMCPYKGKKVGEVDGGLKGGNGKGKDVDGGGGGGDEEDGVTVKKERGESAHETEDCGEMFSTHFEAVNHYKATHCWRTIQCHLCGTFFSNQTTKARHLVEIHGEEPSIACDKCEEKFSTKSQLDKHRQIVHEEKKKTECIKYKAKSRCPVCNYDLNMYLYGASRLRVGISLMLHHYELEHPDLILRCQRPDCNESFVYEFELHRHLKKVHDKVATVNKQRHGQFQCPFCVRVYKIYGHLQFHIEEKHPDKVSTTPKYFCEEPDCDESFSRKRLLQIHARQKHSKPGSSHPHPKKPPTTSECPICHASFFRVGEHMRSMHEVSVACRFCFKVFEDKRELRQHRLIHLKRVNKPQTCAQCGKVLKSTNVLRAHVQAVHQGVRHACPHCDKTYTRISDMRGHVRSVHDGFKLPCRFCPILFLRGSQRNQHERNVHGDDMVKDRG